MVDRINKTSNSLLAINEQYKNKKEAQQNLIAITNAATQNFTLTLDLINNKNNIDSEIQNFEKAILAKKAELKLCTNAILELIQAHKQNSSALLAFSNKK